MIEKIKRGEGVEISVHPFSESSNYSDRNKVLGTEVAIIKERTGDFIKLTNNLKSSISKIMKD